MAIFNSYTTLPKGKTSAHARAVAFCWVTTVDLAVFTCLHQELVARVSNLPSGGQTCGIFIVEPGEERELNDDIRQTHDIDQVNEH